MIILYHTYVKNQEVVFGNPRALTTLRLGIACESFHKIGSLRELDAKHQKIAKGDFPILW
ncbi:hypothetical protein IJI76_01440 [Candidatus Saccharibacteria bacterium]|nr:hypothetical protein [Candidatus Saccharibacteria bacterium]